MHGARAQRSTDLVADSGRFMLDGRPIQIISGEMHYARVPREYWRDRLRKARAMGLNTISTYVFWNLHEASPGQYDFSGQKDVAEFIRLAGEEGLHVILRPGPYVCAEWDLGGYPAWLFADTAIVLRSTDPNFTAPAERWLDRLGRELTPLLASHGGPIIAVQVENEYGSFDRDTAYMDWQRRALDHAGFTGIYRYTADGDVQLPRGTRPGLGAVVNFGIGGADSAFARLARFRPGAPLMSGEYWAGLVRSVGPPAQHDESRAPGRRARMDARSRLFGESVHVSWRDDVRLHERREHRQRALLPADVELRLRRRARRVGSPDAEVLRVSRADRQAHGRFPAARPAERLDDRGIAIRALVSGVFVVTTRRATARRSATEHGSVRPIVRLH